MEFSPLRGLRSSGLSSAERTIYFAAAGVIALRKVLGAKKLCFRHPALGQCGLQVQEDSRELAYEQLRMIRQDLEGLPPLEVPAECELRTYQPGDEEAWVRIMNSGIGRDWTVKKAREKLFERPQFLPEGLFFAVINGRPVGSACAWRNSPQEYEHGIVHMVCVLPEARGRNLGYFLTLAVLHYLRDHGFIDASLTTDDFRLPAIKTYLRLGFRPDCPNPSHVRRWERILKLLADK